MIYISTEKCIPCVLIASFLYLCTRFTTYCKFGNLCVTFILQFFYAILEFMNEYSCSLQA